MQYYEEIGKPTPKVEVMQYLKAKQYVDAKDFAGECEAVVVVAKGQGTCHAHAMPYSYRSSSQFRLLPALKESLKHYCIALDGNSPDVQGTCKYGTRVDYIMASPNCPYKFVPGSYTVVSSKGTSDHHVVRVDVAVPHAREPDDAEATANGQRSRVVKMTKKSSRKGIWGAK